MSNNKPITLGNVCAAIYHKDGQVAVFEFARQYLPGIPWGWCGACEITSPADPSDNSCLVCGHLVSNLNRRSCIDCGKSLSDAEVVWGGWLCGACATVIQTVQRINA